MAEDRKKQIWRAIAMSNKERVFDKKETERAVAVAFPMGNIVFPMHLANAQTPYCPTRSKPMAAAIHLLFAYSRSGKGNRACSEILRKNRNQTVNGGVTFEMVKICNLTEFPEIVCCKTDA